MTKHAIVTWVAVAGYPALHAAASATFQYWPEPGAPKSWYSLLYHLVERWAAVKQEGAK